MCVRLSVRNNQSGIIQRCQRAQAIVYECLSWRLLNHVRNSQMHLVGLGVYEDDRHRSNIQLGSRRHREESAQQMEQSDSVLKLPFFFSSCRARSRL